ncbi:acetyl-CoA-benzylalcohol acetyltransferase-like [Rhodamnia argentea]|uniref:Acetyl-CoA-benzylalcohol acetyltransferase-like n=1 Tax=Rhodamnia argentea TaxID=178133 RepID=A0A8B8PVJ6_9MYRT|nr:acetyl-CoA-benzylalcohol acetyltransferase-like [Rhodamnia argentea]XP_048135706.1 acetyl-CoA-benzylalcohol acetyltransferase-like [Rhodamnia argentea]
MSRFRFSSNSISKLKAQARQYAKDSMANDFQLSRVEVVSALISRALVDVDQHRRGEQRVFVVYMTVNLRRKINLAIPANSCGNLFALMFARSDPPIVGESKLEFNGMVNLIRHMIADAKTKYAMVGDGEELCSMVGTSLTELAKTWCTGEECLINFTSWCLFRLYENDFGWGRPVLVSNTPVNLGSIVLIDDEESGGIDAWITVNEDEMILLKQDPEILAFTS